MNIGSTTHFGGGFFHVGEKPLNKDALYALTNKSDSSMVVKQVADSIDTMSTSDIYDPGNREEHYAATGSVPVRNLINIQEAIDAEGRVGPNPHPSIRQRAEQAQQTFRELITNALDLPEHIRQLQDRPERTPSPNGTRRSRSQEQEAPGTSASATAPADDTEARPRTSSSRIRGNRSGGFNRRYGGEDNQR